MSRDKGGHQASFSAGNASAEEPAQEAARLPEVSALDKQMLLTPGPEPPPAPPTPLTLGPGVWTPVVLDPVQPGGGPERQTRLLTSLQAQGKCHPEPALCVANATRPAPSEDSVWPPRTRDHAAPSALAWVEFSRLLPGPRKAECLEFHWNSHSAHSLPSGLQ